MCHHLPSPGTAKSDPFIPPVPAVDSVCMDSSVCAGALLQPGHFREIDAPVAVHPTIKTGERSLTVVLESKCALAYREAGDPLSRRDRSKIPGAIIRSCGLSKEEGRRILGVSRDPSAAIWAAERIRHVEDYHE